MSIMEQAYQDQLEGALHAQEQAYEGLCEAIQQYIEDCNYTWTLESFFEQYRKYKAGEYISFTAKDIINKFKNHLEEVL